jgi:hypothetical protein
MFAALECVQLMFVPACLRCGGTGWRDDIDELATPENRSGGSA